MAKKKQKVVPKKKQKVATKKKVTKKSVVKKKQKVTTKKKVAKKKAPTRKVNRNARIVDPEEHDGGEDEWVNNEAAIDERLAAVNFDNMEKEDLLLEIRKVDKEYLRINFRLSGLSKKKRHVFRGDADALTLQLRTLKQRSDMLFKCLDKVLPDKRELSGKFDFTATETDQIPTKILQKIVMGTLTDEEYEHYAHLFEKAEAKEDEETRH